MNKNLVFYGIQGSGKGTQADLLVKDYNYVVFSTGNELRSHVKNQTPLGQEVEQIINSGQHVSDEIIVELVKDFYSKNKDKKIIFDGIIRNLEQYNTINQFFKENNIETIALYLDLDKDDAIQRIMSRAAKENRQDDNIESAQKRISLFFEKTLPVIESYPESQIVKVNAKQSIEEVYNEIKQKLNLQ